ncbi:MAG: PhnD/SsuA/transferrin family substrate-binding protein [Actinomycetota bacterium]|nr:PhnD/SsuA/transferrin family substrate-binding protein [Actinomycetota bacterium]
MKILRFASFLAPSVWPTYQYITDFVGKSLGIETDLHVGASLDEFDAGKTDAAFICGLPYVVLADRPEPSVEPIVAPILVGHRYEGRPIYFSDVIVRHDSDVRRFTDLRGKTWAYNEPLSQSGYGIVRHRLAEMDEDWSFFGDIVRAGYHQTSIDLVVGGAVEAAAIDSQVLEIELGLRPELGDQLRIIEVLGPSTIQPLVARRGLPSALKTELREILCSFGREPAARHELDKTLFDRFIAVDDAAYNDIRSMHERSRHLTQFKQDGPPPRREPTLRKNVGA